MLILPKYACLRSSSICFKILHKYVQLITHPRPCFPLECIVTNSMQVMQLAVQVLGTLITIYYKETPPHKFNKLIIHEKLRGRNNLRLSYVYILCVYFNSTLHLISLKFLLSCFVLWVIEPTIHFFFIINAIIKIFKINENKLFQ